MLIEQLTLTNILSFGPQPETVTFGPLTVLIGANGSGKSNLLEVIDLLRNAPDQVLKPIREGGGIDEWWHKADIHYLHDPSVTAVVRLPGLGDGVRLQYCLSLSGTAGRATIEAESIAGTQSAAGDRAPAVYFRSDRGAAQLNVQGILQPLPAGSFEIGKSVLAQRRDPINYPEITGLADRLGGIRLHREWSFGRYTPSRMPQRADMPIGWLESDASNLGLVLSHLASNPTAKASFLDALRELYAGIGDFGVDIVSGSVQIYLHEGRFKIPATRLSDGTLRYLCLLAILCHPDPPPIVCIEEPELGLHPDIIRTVAKLLKEASERCQLIVTTHSEVLVDAMTDTPESIVVCEKIDGATKLRRLSEEDLKPWLERYSLGQLWTRGDIGGNRW